MVGTGTTPSLSGALARACLFPGSSSRLGVNIWGGWVGSRMMQIPRAAMGSSREGLQAPRMPFLLGNLLPSAPTSAASQVLVPASNLCTSQEPHPPIFCVPLTFPKASLGHPSSAQKLAAAPLDPVKCLSLLSIPQTQLLHL